MPQVIYTYKGTLIGRTEFAADGLVAHVTVPQQEINDYSPLYNPGPLVQFDMLQVRGVRMSIVFKQYDDGRAHRLDDLERVGPPHGVAEAVAHWFRLPAGAP